MGFINKKITGNIGMDNKIQRDKWINERLSSIPKGLKILDAGAGEQQYKKYCTHLEYTSQDFCQYEGTGDSAGLQTGTFDTSQIDIVSDIASIPCEAKTFDVILCTEVLEHVPYPDKAIKELTRLLKNGGTLIITAPFNSLTHYAPFHFYSGFNKYFYQKILEGDYEIKELVANGNFFDYISQEIRRINEIAKKYSSKKMKFMSKLLIVLLLALLNKFKKFDSGSYEVLCYGYQLVAIKK